MVQHFIITKLNCQGCVAKARDILSQLDNVTDIEIDLATGDTQITSKSPIDAALVITAIESNSNWHVEHIA